MSNDPQVLSEQELSLLRCVTDPQFKKISATLDHERALRERAENSFAAIEKALNGESSDALNTLAQKAAGLVRQLTTEKALRVQAEAALKDEQRYSAEKNQTANVFMNQVKKLQTKEHELQQQLLACQLERERMREALEKIIEGNQHLIGGVDMPRRNVDGQLASIARQALTSSTPSSVIEDISGVVDALKGFLGDGDIEKEIKDARAALAKLTKHGLGKGGE